MVKPNSLLASNFDTVYSIHNQIIVVLHQKDSIQLWWMEENIQNNVSSSSVCTNIAKYYFYNFEQSDRHFVVQLLDQHSEVLKYNLKEFADSVYIPHKSIFRASRTSFQSESILYYPFVTWIC